MKVPFLTRLRNKRRRLSQHILLSISFLVFFILMNRGDIILISRLGAVAWYPATGLVFALLLGVSPWYAIVVSLAAGLAGKIIYGQSLSTFGETIGSIGISIFYAIAAYVLRGRLKIDPELRRRRDVVLYVSLTTLAAIGSTTVGVACLAADHTIRWREFWSAAFMWLIGDEVGLLGVAPFLLVHICPWVRRQLVSSHLEPFPKPRRRRQNLWEWLEALGQAVCIVLVLWVMFGPSAGQSLYLVFIPVIWVALRQGMRRVVSCLLILNFGIVVAFHLYSQPPALLGRTGLLMFVVSSVGLFVGVLVSERHYIAKELLERTTKLVEANRQLVLATFAAEDASRTKGEFLANMSHEIRTPINGILGMAELVLNTELSKEQREYLTMLKSSGDSLLLVINDILDFSKIESGRLSLESIEFNLADAVAETMQVLGITAHKKGLEIAYEISPEVPARVVGDPMRVRQVLTNLVGNAVKFTHEGEVIARIKVEAQRDEEMVLHFSVSDTGVGIAEQKQETVFEAFAQADGSTTRHYGGTGLGLAICSRLVSIMNGRIWLESTVGRGSVFHFSVPCRVGTKSPESDAAHSEFSNVPLLIVDDNASNGEILSRIAKSLGMLPTVVNGARHALEAIRREDARGAAFPLALIDGMMPEMSGFELASSIRQSSCSVGEIIMMITSRLDQQPTLCRDLGIANCILKPAKKSDLVAAFSSALGGRSQGAASHPVSGSESREQGRRLRILVAEDNPINQIVAVRMLETLGHMPAIAQDGRKALAMLVTQEYDAVLMDVQMPGIDGLAAAHEIRRRERHTGTHIPIIAMTAHALKGDRERCLAAGMDGYLAKPVNSKDLEDALSEGVHSQFKKVSVLSSFKPLDRRVEWDFSAALSTVDGDRTLLRELAQIFLEEAPKAIRKLQQAVSNADHKLIERTAHTLKGEFGYLGFPEAAQAASDLERAGREQRLAAAEFLLSDVTARAAGIRQAIQCGLDDQLGSIDH